METFEIAFKAELQKLQVSADLQIITWNEIKTSYSNNKRYYHNLAHLDKLIGELSDVKNEIDDWQVIVFAVAYHDIIYNVLKSDNEERSARVAVSRLKEIGLADDKVFRCEQHILATKGHHASEDNDMNLFTDADLAILGSQTDQYLQYVQQIRDEYNYFPDLLYKPGRKKVLRHFLDMPSIYKTRSFNEKYEHQARQNISVELTLL